MCNPQTSLLPTCRWGPSSCEAPQPFVSQDTAREALRTMLPSCLPYECAAMIGQAGGSVFFGKQGGWVRRRGDGEECKCLSPSVTSFRTGPVFLALNFQRAANRCVRPVWDRCWNAHDCDTRKHACLSSCVRASAKRRSIMAPHHIAHPHRRVWGGPGPAGRVGGKRVGHATRGGRVEVCEPAGVHHSVEDRHARASGAVLLR